MDLLYMLSFNFLIIGLILNKKNAKLLLSGYNTMSDEERGNFDIEEYMKFFKSFFILLSISYLIIGLFIRSNLDQTTYIIYCIAYPFIWLLYLVFKTNSYYLEKKKIGLNVLIGVGVLCLILVSIGIGVRPTEVILKDNSVWLKGPYGEHLTYSEINDIKKVPSPTLIKKVEGFELGNFKKGLFMTTEGETVCVLMSKRDSSMLILTDRKKIFLDYDKNIANKIELNLK